MSILNDCDEMNADGAGFMFVHNNMVHIYKGFINARALIRKRNSVFSSMKVNPNDIPIVYHFRIATHGGVNARNCHPFPVTDNVAKLTAHKSKAEMGVAHNGVLPIIDYKDKDSSDTQQFVKHCLSRMTMDEISKNSTLISMVLKSDRLIVMNKDGGILRFGTWHDEDGLLFSNLSYKRAATKREEKAKKAEKKNSNLTVINGGANFKDYYGYGGFSGYDSYHGYVDSFRYRNNLKKDAIIYEPCDLCSTMVDNKELSVLEMDGLLLSVCVKCCRYFEQNKEYANNTGVVLKKASPAYLAVIKRDEALNAMGEERKEAEKKVKEKLEQQAALELQQGRWSFLDG